MTTACMTAEAGQLARRETRHFKHRQSTLFVCRPLVNLVAQMSTAWVSKLAAVSVNSLAGTLNAQAIRIRGASSIVFEDDSIRPLDEKFELVDGLIEMELKVRELRNSTANIVQKRRARSATEVLTGAFESVVEAARGLEHEVRVLQRAVLEHELNRAVLEVPMGAKHLSFSPQAAVEAVLLIIQRLGRAATFHEILKLRYFADTIHLSQFGALASGDVYKAMKFGPVGSHTYNLLKAARGDESDWIHPEFVEAAAAALEVANGKLITARRQPNFNKLSRSEISALEEAIERYGHMSFNERTALSHDPAWKEAWDDAIADDMRAGRMKVLSIARTLENADEVIEHLTA